MMAPSHAKELWCSSYYAVIFDLLFMAKRNRDYAHENPLVDFNIQRRCFGVADAKQHSDRNVLTGINSQLNSVSHCSPSAATQQVSTEKRRQLYIYMNP